METGNEGSTVNTKNDRWLPGNDIIDHKGNLAFKASSCRFKKENG